MRRPAAVVLCLLYALAIPRPVAAQQPPPGPAATPADYILLTVILRHDQSKTLDEINKHLDETGFWGKFPPDGITVESWYIVMGIGHVRHVSARSIEPRNSLRGSLPIGVLSHV